MRSETAERQSFRVGDANPKDGCVECQLADSFLVLAEELAFRAGRVIAELERATEQQEWAAAARAERALVTSVFELVEVANNLRGVRTWLDQEL